MSERDDKRGRGEEAGAPDLPPSPEESRAAERLRRALEAPTEAAGAHEALDIVNTLRAAWSPGSLDEADHAAIVDDLPVSAEEASLAAALRDALDRHEAPEIVAVLRSAWQPAALSEEEHRAIVDAAVDRRDRVVKLRPPVTRRVFVVTTTTLALAASVIVWITTSAPPAEAPLARSRSTQPLFAEPFRAGDASSRIDRIAVARASDYRDNRFAKWGVR
ncbi:MAG TPA: hypothetical protein VM925_16755 [Labilithrix sp.]|nr:hypothetical protein [Labilithrix sp.]